jgi:hypothetical protein
MHIDETETNSIQATVCNIHWSNPRGRRVVIADLPSEMTLNIPNGVIEQAKKSKKTTVEDMIETFCCNVLTNKFGAEVHSCQIFL